MARKMPYTNFHDLNLDWIIKRIQNVYNDENPPDYPVKTVNGQVGNVHLTGDDIPVSPNDSTEISTALSQKYVKPAGGIPESDLAPGVVKTIYRGVIPIQGNTTNADISRSFSASFPETFTNNHRVISYDGPEINNYRDFTVNISTHSISGSVTVKPGAASDYLTIYIAETEELM